MGAARYGASQDLPHPNGDQPTELDLLRRVQDTIGQPALAYAMGCSVSAVQRKLRGSLNTSLKDWRGIVSDLSAGGHDELAADVLNWMLGDTPFRVVRIDDEGGRAEYLAALMRDNRVATEQLMAAHADMLKAFEDGRIDGADAATLEDAERRITLGMAGWSGVLRRAKRMAGAKL